MQSKLEVKKQLAKHQTTEIVSGLVNISNDNEILPEDVLSVNSINVDKILTETDLATKSTNVDETGFPVKSTYDEDSRTVVLSQEKLFGEAVEVIEMVSQQEILSEETVQEDLHTLIEGDLSGNDISFQGILKEYNSRNSESEVIIDNMRKQLEEQILENVKLKKEIAIKNKILEVRNLRISEVEDINFKLQNQVVDGMLEVSELIKGQTARIEGEQFTAEPFVGRITRDYRKFHMGRGEFLNVENYALAMSNVDKPSQFVKNLSVAVFGKDILRKSTVSGRKSNRSKDEEIPPALDSTKLLAIYDTYKYWLKKERKFSQNEADLEGMKTFSYVSRQIGDLKCNRKKKIYKQVSGRKIIGIEAAEKEAEVENNEAVGVEAA
ncbi:uncharacterized protein LOC127277851 isoform X2 [Leptopilina boulardi]|uniref:uncharacterized protein LOC127277851 isoform X1 n=1 Tax=Leptopilina boulardi TaxID=63433 RepID=UPI0021F5BEC0|nr:uncharacterized protein LOC127277851 isoform X1 [Leptopilina boulardi]XP_051155199.1 uncharacterized protein LOC127277851 isoform X2 [Leptopilina boulardi]